MDINIKDYSKYFFLIYVVALIVVVSLMLKPVFTAILLALILTIIFIPLYHRLANKSQNKDLAAIITVLLMVLVLIIFVIIPSIFLLKTLSQEVVWQTYVTVRLKLNQPVIMDACTDNNLLCLASQKLSEVYQTEPTAKRTIDTALDNMLNQGTTFVSDFLLSTPEIFLNLFIIVFTAFYLIRDYDTIAKKIQNLVPLSDYYTKKLVAKINSTVYGLIYGSILIALAQGLAGAIGYFIFGVENYIVFGALTTFVAFIPYIGTFVVWGLLSIKMIVIGYATANPDMFFNGISLFIYGSLVISLVDNILKPRIIGQKANTHPVLILIGIVGGSYLFGLPGLIIGPVLMAVFESVVSFYEEIYKRPSIIDNKE